MAAIVAFAFLVVWSPVWILLIRSNFIDGHFSCSLAFAAGPAISSYTVLNPLVYYVFNEGYRKGMNEIVLCGRTQVIFQFSSTNRSKSSVRSQKSESLLIQTAV